MFATQDVVPGLGRERVYLLQALASLASGCPDRHIIIKPRGAPGEKTLHTEKHHLADLLARELRGMAPPNLLVEYGPLSDFLAFAGLLATVSSTAALEALAAGVPAAILTDLGIKESLGNHYFLGSGMYSSILELKNGRVPMPAPRWLRANGLGGCESLAALDTAIAEILSDWRAGGTLPPLVERCYSPERNAGLDQFVLQTGQQLPAQSAGHAKDKGKLLGRLSRLLP